MKKKKKKWIVKLIIKDVEANDPNEAEDVVRHELLRSDFGLDLWDMFVVCLESENLRET